MRLLAVPVFFFITMLSISAFAFEASAPKPMTFNQAKAMLSQHVEQDGDLDYYCGCKIKKKGRQYRIDLESCNFEVRANPERAQRGEFEHVASAWAIGHQRQCWKEGGRKNCTANDPVFTAAEGDPINLLLVVGSVNQDRSNYNFGMLNPKTSQGYGPTCGSYVDFKARTFMPREDARGVVARINFYMRDTYNLRLSRQQTQLFDAWARQHPVTQRECTRNYRIFKASGYHNPYVTAHCQ